MQALETQQSQALASSLRGFSGTEHYYKHPLNTMLIYTDGVRHLAINGGAYWLLDIVASYTPKVTKHAKANDETMFTVTFKRFPDEGGLFEIRDRGGNLVQKQTVTFTDFPLQEITLYLGARDESLRGWILCLPTED